MALDNAALKTECTTDPVGLGYPAWALGNEVALAEVINNEMGDKPRTVTSDEAETGAIRAATTFEAFDGLVAASQAWFEWLTVGGIITVNDEILQQLAGIPVTNDSIWAAADRDEMNAAMAGVLQFTGSRAQEIDGVLGQASVLPAEFSTAIQELP